MKKNYSLIAFAMLALFCLAFVSCGEDNDEPETTSDSNSNGQVTFAYENAITEQYFVIQSTYGLWSQDVIETTHITYDDGVTFDVVFDDGNHRYIYWQFQTRDEIKKGASLSIDCVFLNNDPRDVDETEGKAIVKSFSKDKITLSFKNFSFKRYIAIDSNKRQKVTVNGEITFRLEDYEDY